MSRRLLALHLLILAVACVVVFSNTFENSFHFDDAHRVKDNPGVQEFWPPWRHFVDPGTSATLDRVVQYRPLLPLSLSINYAIAGDSLVGYHLGNLLLQILASFAFYALLRELLDHWVSFEVPRHGALLVALLFAVHPVSGVVVNYICARDLIMMEMFLLGSLAVYARMRRLGETAGRWGLCLGLLLASLLAKKNAVAAPALVLLFEGLLAGSSLRDRSIWRRVGVFTILVAGYLALVRYGLGFSDYSHVVSTADSPAAYAAAQLQHHVFHYLRNFVWPFPIRLGPDDPVVLWRQVVGAMVIAAAFVLAWRWRRRRPLAAFAILGYAGMLALTSSWIVFHAEIVAYRSYPASAFFFLLVGTVLLRWRRVGGPVMVALAVYFGLSSYLLNRTWKDPVTACRHSIAHGARSLVYVSLGDALPPGPERIAAYQHAAAARDDAFAWLGLARAEVEWGTAQGDRALQNQGLARLGEVLAHVANIAQARYTAAQILYGLRALPQKLQQAADHAQRASELAPQNQLYRCMAGKFAVEAGRYERGLEIIRPLLEQRPDYNITRLCAGIALMELRRFQEAAPLIETFVRQYPNHFFAWRHLGFVRMGLEDWRGAAAALQTAAEGNPEIPGVQEALAECRRRIGE